MKALPADATRRLTRGAALTAAVLAGLLGADSMPAGARPAARPSPKTTAPVSLATFTPSPTRGAIVAHPVARVDLDARPGGGRRVWQTPGQTPWGAQPVSLLVLGARRVGSTVWLELRLPIRPNTAAGWAPAARLRLRHSPWWVQVHTASRHVDVYRHGRLVRSFSAVVGKPSTPTPHGLFAVYEKIREPDPTGFLGPWALHLTAHSNVLFEFGGGPGRVALHGRDGASLLDPLGTADSHGCVRVLNADIDFLAVHLADGDPVQITP